MTKKIKTHFCLRIWTRIFTVTLWNINPLVWYRFEGCSMFHPTDFSADMWTDAPVCEQYLWQLCACALPYAMCAIARTSLLCKRPNRERNLISTVSARSLVFALIRLAYRAQSARRPVFLPAWRLRAYRRQECMVTATESEPPDIATRHTDLLSVYECLYGYRSYNCGCCMSRYMAPNTRVCMQTHTDTHTPVISI